MKKIILFALAALMLYGCGPAAAVMADLAMISLTSDQKQTVVVKVDNTQYNVKTRKKKKTQTLSSKQPAKQPTQPATQQRTASTSTGSSVRKTTGTNVRTTTGSAERNATGTTPKSGSSAVGSNSRTTDATASSGRTTTTSSRTSTTKSVTVESGQHDVQVIDSGGKQVYSERVNLSSSEHKIIELNE